MRLFSGRSEMCGCKKNIAIFIFCLLLGSFALAVKEVNVADFGAVAGDGSDTTQAVIAALEKCRGKYARLIFPTGRYDFWPDFGVEKFFFISNNDEGLKRIAFPVFGFKNLEIDGQGSEFVFHGYVNPFILENSKNVTIRNLSIDFERTFHSESTIIADHEDGVDIEISEQFPYEINHGILVFTDGEQSTERKSAIVSHKNYYPFGGVLEFDSQKREVAYMASDAWIKWGVPAKAIEGRKVRLFDSALNGAVGNIMVFGPSVRKIPGVVISDSVGVTLENVTFYHCGGMGVIGQRSGDIKLEKVIVTPRPNSGRMISICADATHFVNCFGKIEMSHCVFENQKDDPTNIHGIYAKIVRKIADDEIVVQLIHEQQLGFDFIEPGKQLELVHGPSLITYGQGKVKEVERYNKEFTRVKFSKPLPAELILGDSVAEIRDYAEVYIHDCRMRGNRARGFLLNCRGKTLVENNYFHVPGSAILFEGDARYWFEQAGASDCVIRNNVFDNCNYSVWGTATIEVSAGIEKEHQAKSRYNRNILIEGNTFKVFGDTPLLKAYSVDGLVFRDNKIERTDAYPSKNLGVEPFMITDCDNVKIEN